MSKKSEIKFEEGYAVSTDYEQLAELPKAAHKILCFVDYQGYRDVCRAKFHHSYGFMLSVRGMAYTQTDDEQTFLNDCEVRNLTWVIPSSI